MQQSQDIQLPLRKERETKEFDPSIEESKKYEVINAKFNFRQFFKLTYYYFLSFFVLGPFSAIYCNCRDENPFLFSLIEVIYHTVFWMLGIEFYYNCFTQNFHIDNLPTNLVTILFASLFFSYEESFINKKKFNLRRIQKMLKVDQVFYELKKNYPPLKPKSCLKANFKNMYLST